VLAAERGETREGESKRMGRGKRANDWKTETDTETGRDFQREREILESHRPVIYKCTSLKDRQTEKSM